MAGEYTPGGGEHIRSADQKLAESIACIARELENGVGAFYLKYRDEMPADVKSALHRLYLERLNKYPHGSMQYRALAWGLCLGDRIAERTLSPEELHHDYWNRLKNSLCALASLGQSSGLDVYDLIYQGGYSFGKRIEAQEGTSVFKTNLCAPEQNMRVRRIVMSAAGYPLGIAHCLLLGSEMSRESDMTPEDMYEMESDSEAFSVVEGITTCHIPWLKPLGCDPDDDIGLL